MLNARVTKDLMGMGHHVHVSHIKEKSTFFVIVTVEKKLSLPSRVELLSFVAHQKSD